MFKYSFLGYGRICIVVCQIVIVFAGSRPSCLFDVFNASTNSRPLAFVRPNEEPAQPRIVWSKLDHIPIRSPTYATFAMSELSNTRINLMSGAVFDSKGCTAEHFMKTPEYHNRLRFLPGLAPGPLHKNSEVHRFDGVSTLIYFGGSLHSKDWQHAVIDFLPMFDFVLPFIAAAGTGVAVITGKYYRFFESLFPFSTVKFIPKDYGYKDYRLFPNAPTFTIAKMIYVDILNRDQSYLQRGAYDRIIPYLLDSVETARAKSNSCKVVYLDRSQLINDTSYIKTAGKVLGRSVVDQPALLATIKKVLKPECEFITWSCKDWTVDRNVFRDANVIIGPHGGHFVNMIFCRPGTHVVELGRSPTLRQLRNVTGTGVKNARLVFAGMSAALGHTHWFIEDSLAVENYLKKKVKPVWSDADIVVDKKQVVDTLRAIGVAK